MKAKHCICAFLAACPAAFNAFAAPVVPGEFTDPTNVRRELASLPVSWYVAPDHLKFPYIATYHVKPTVTTKEKVAISFFVTDWDNSKVRFGDDTFRFDVHIAVASPDGKTRGRTLRNLPSGDGSFEFKPFPKGEYSFSIWASDKKGRESHRVWHKFRVVSPEDLEIPARQTYRMQTADLARYSIRNDDGLERVIKPEPEAVATAEGLQKLLDDKAAEGFRKVVLLPGAYRISAFRKISIPDGMTLDLNGATLKENGFTGCSSVMVAIENGVRDAHLVNGTLEGDVDEHDYEGSEKNSEWPMGFSMSGDVEYCSVENVTVKNITGYGGGNGLGKGRDGKGTSSFWPKPIPNRGWTAGGLDAKTGKVDESEKGRFTCDFFRIKGIEFLEVTRLLGYQGICAASWTMTCCWYDGEKKFLSSETLFQYRTVPVPKNAEFIRFSLVVDKVEEAYRGGCHLANWSVPRNCAIRNCVFDNCRCVGYAASAMKNMLFESNTFTRCGRALAKCAFDAEDGWDMMQDVTFRGNRCVDNPVNNSLLACAGHNFVFEGNDCDIFLWPRNYSPCVRNNTIRRATFHCQSRGYSGYGRFENNRYGESITIESPRRFWFGWDYALSGLDFTSGDADFKMNLGPSARLYNCRFKGRTIRVPMMAGCSLEDVETTRLSAADWLGVTATGGGISILSGTNRFVKCSFAKFKISGLQPGASVFRDCTFNDFKIYGSPDKKQGVTRLEFDGCTFSGASGINIGYWAGRVDAVFRNCVFDVGGEAFFSIPSYSAGDILFEGCRGNGGGACGSLLYFHDFRGELPGGGKTMVELRKCAFKSGFGVIVGVPPNNVTGKKSAKQEAEFVFSGCKLGPDVKEFTEMLPVWKKAKGKSGKGNRK